MKQHTAVISPSLSLSYRTAGDPSKPCLLLIHGYPQTSYMYRHVIPLLAAEGYYVLAPDYRGAGDSIIAEDGYDKFTMARDLRTLYRGLGVEKVVVVGIDIGSMVGTALALQYRDEVVALFASGEYGIENSLYAVAELIT
jgi:pimeloyl-ACP methyl ester carboxylesterase